MWSVRWSVFNFNGRDLMSDDTRVFLEAIVIGLCVHVEWYGFAATFASLSIVGLLRSIVSHVRENGV